MAPNASPPPVRHVSDKCKHLGSIRPCAKIPDINPSASASLPAADEAPAPSHRIGSRYGSATAAMFNASPTGPKGTNARQAE